MLGGGGQHARYRYQVLLKVLLKPGLGTCPGCQWRTHMPGCPLGLLSQTDG